MSEDVVLVTKEEPVATVTVNRPKALNALNSEVLEALGKAFDEIAADDGIKVVIVTGAGDKAFIAGADIKAMVKMSPMEARAFMSKGHQVMNKIECLEKPVIAALNGFTLGGGLELAMACDIRYASEKAKLGLPEVTLGIHPGFGGTIRLPRLVGKGKACEMVFTGGMIGAAEAKEIGLVQKVIPPEKLDEEVQGLAKKIASVGPVAVKLAKSCVNRGLGTDQKTALAYEVDSCAMTFSTEDLREGMTAFLEKRKPEFKNK